MSLSHDVKWYEGKQDMRQVGVEPMTQDFPSVKVLCTYLGSVEVIDDSHGGASSRCSQQLIDTY